ncbi:WAT1-related protein [Acorus calamus]|uniref:WAT1-related protein n=1 Tax=Acorus calamus TaxID=4465 RepID=A0AAV9D466_ACOCL|nr:WAT1-related protein [Acorus calamus]
MDLESLASRDWLIHSQPSRKKETWKKEKERVLVASGGGGCMEKIKEPRDVEETLLDGIGVDFHQCLVWARLQNLYTGGTEVLCSHQWHNNAWHVRHGGENEWMKWVGEAYGMDGEDYSKEWTPSFSEIPDSDADYGCISYTQSNQLVTRTQALMSSSPPKTNGPHYANHVAATPPNLATLFHCFRIQLAMGLYYYGLRDTTATYSTYFLNLIPIVTFLFAVTTRIEKLGLSSNAGRMKILGTVVCVGGALMTGLYRGITLVHGDTHFGLHARAQTVAPVMTNMTRGTLFLCCSCLSYAVWFLVQGALNTGATFVLLSWVISRRGPTYPAMFNALTLIFIAILDCAIMGQDLTLGRYVFRTKK